LINTKTLTIVDVILGIAQFANDAVLTLENVLGQAFNLALCL